MNFKKLFNILLLAFIAVVPLIPLKVKVGNIPLSPDFVLGGLLIGAGMLALMQMIIKKEKFFDLIKNKNVIFVSIFVAIFIALSLFSFTYANNKQAVINEAIRFMEYVFIFYLIIFIGDTKIIDRGFALFYSVMVLAAIYGVIQYVFNLSEFTVGGLFGRGRIYATFVNPNYWGAAVNMVIFYPLICLMDQDTKKSSRKYHIAAFILLLFNMLFSSTRGSWLGFAFGVFVIGLMRYRRYVAYSIGIVAALFLVPITRSRFLQVLNIQERLSLWKTGLYMFRDNFLFGVGNGNYIFEYKNYIKKHPELYLGRKKFSVHNSYIKMLSELGIFGGAAFMAVYFGLFSIVLQVYKFSSKYKMYALAFIGFGASYLLQNMFNNLMFIPQLNVFTWILIAFFYKGMLLENNK